MATVPVLPSLQIGLPPLSLVGNVDPSVPSYLLKLSQVINNIIEFLKRLAGFPLIYGTGQVTLSGGSSTSGTLTFTTVTPDTSYQLLITPSAFVQGANPFNAGAFQVISSSKTTASATFTTMDSPGTGNTVTFDWAVIHA